MKNQPSLLRFVILLIFVSLAASSALAQSNAIPARVTQPVDLHNLVTLPGNVHPLARPEFDQGSAPDDLPMERMLLVLKRSDAQEASLRQLMDDQQVKSSGRFHQWLTPEQFGQQFGPVDSDLQAVTGWLSSQGFQIGKVSAGRTVIEFTGSAGLVRQALGAQVHRYSVNGESYWANATSPEIPAALAPVIAGIASLNDFPRQSSSHIVDEFYKSTQTGAIHRLFTVPTSSTANVYAVGPYDFATIYNVLPLWNAGIDGTGQTVAILAQSNINYGDVQSFQITFGLPITTIDAILNGPDPGIVQTDETEALLDVTWSGAVAKGATIDMVISQSTSSTLGVDLSAEYAVDNDLAPVISESYGDCEENLGAAGNAFQFSIREQAAAEGITYINSSGDAGSARCDQGEPEYAASAGLAVSGLASTPFNVAVGGTDFADNNNWAPYWSTANAANYASAKSYIPESTWNASCAASGQAGNCTNALSDTPEGVDLEAGGGGPSTCGSWSGTSCVSGYPKPAWQTGTGIPNDGVRDIPDISLFASTGTNGSFYVLCEADAVQGNPSCSGGSNWYFIGVGGTSVAAPDFAGIMALVNQKTGQRQGNANYVLYPLAATSGASCTSNAAAITNTNCIFYDVVSGNNSVACSGGSPNCSDKSSGGFGILLNPGNTSLPAWTTNTGYDMTTGLGTLNVANLVNKWSSVTFQSSTTTLSALPTTVVHGQPADFTVSVASSAGSPTGEVGLIGQVSGTQNQDLGTYTLAGGGTVSASNDTLPGGTYNIFAHYAGDGIHGASDSAAHPITVTPESSLTNASVSTCSYSTGTCASGVSIGVYGSSYATVLANVTNAGGQPCTSASGTINYPCPTGYINLSVDSGSLPYNLSGSYSLNNQADAQISPISVPAGTYDLLVDYAGDDSYGSSISAKTPVSITQAPTITTLSGLPAAIVAGNLGDVTITVNTTSRGAIPSTQTPLQFLVNGTLTSAGGEIGGSSGSANSYAVLTEMGSPNLPIGTSTVAAVYSGDQNYTGSTSATVNITVTDFSLAANVNSVTIPASGQTGTATLTVTPLGGFAGTVNLDVAGGCPAYATCTVSPSSVTITNSNPATATLSIVTYSNAPPQFRKRLPPNPSLLRAPLAKPWIPLVLILIGLMASLKWVRKPAWVALGVGLATMSAWIACGGGGGGAAYSNNPPPAPAITLSTNALTFAGQKILTTSSTQTVNVTNSGTATLYISNIVNNGVNSGDFAVANGCGLSLNASASCSLGVTFTPRSTGTRSSTIQINPNAAGNPFASFNLSGTGTIGQATFTPSSLTFGPQKFGTISPSQAMTLTNTGAAFLNLLPVSVDGRDFAQTNNCPSILNAGSACTVEVTFTPVGVGAIAEQLQVNSDGVNQTQLAGLNGTGTPPTTAAGNYLIQVNAYSGNDGHAVSIPLTLQ